MVVRYLLVVKDFLRLVQRLAGKRYCKGLIVTQSFQYVRAFGIYVITQECSIYAWVCSYLLLIQRLYRLQCLLGRQPELSVAIHLQRGEVVKTWRELGSVLCCHVSDCKRLSCYFFKSLTSFLLAVETSFCNAECGVPVCCLQFPVGLGYEIFYLKVPFDYKCKGRSLYSANR